ncbi:MAG: VOC family protein [Parvibaculaceae bacterium]
MPLIKLTSVLVDDQEKALKFYTEVVGFVVKMNIPAGGARWITVVSSEEPEGAEAALEPAGFPFAKTYQKALKDAGIPLTAFAVRDIEAEHARLVRAGVAFKSPPAKQGDFPVTAVFDDTCGNYIMLYQL